MPSWTDACGLDEIEEEGVRRVDLMGRTFAVYRMTGEEVFCSDGLCTHEAVHLSEGMVIDYEIECPKHSGIFDIRTGEAKRLPACVNLRTYPARVDGTRILIEI